MLYSDALQHWLATGEVVPSKIQQQEKATQERQKKLYELFAQRGELTYNMEIMAAKLGEINKQIGDLTK
jgi:hypothetical protein